MTHHEDITDEGLVKRHLDGDRTAFDRLAERHAPGVVGAIERVVEDHHLALDLGQEVFLKLHTMLPRYRFEGRFRSMLYSIAINCSRDALRKKRRSRLVFLSDHGSAPEPAEADATASVDRRADIDTCLGDVRSPFREALYLRDVIGLNYEEIAVSMACSLGTAKSRVNRGRLLFRERFEQEKERRRSRPRGNQNVS